MDKNTYIENNYQQFLDDGDAITEENAKKMASIQWSLDYEALRRIDKRRLESLLDYLKGK